MKRIKSKTNLCCSVQHIKTLNFQIQITGDQNKTKLIFTTTHTRANKIKEKTAIIISSITLSDFLFENLDNDEDDSLSEDITENCFLRRK